MSHFDGAQAPLRSALYVDFDNIYLGLKDLDPAAAEQFATDPARWIDWLEQGMPSHEGHRAQSPPRTLLLRHCYLNPRSFYRYRPYFTRTAFSVIDCPPLTTKGKNSSDIHMVMDILDTLDRYAHFEEFVILSGDADFTPVLLRLRAHARRTVILSPGQAAEAYKAACDQLVGEDTFIEDALGMTSGPPNGYSPHHAPPPINSDLRHLMDAMALRVYEEASANGEILAVDLPRLYRDFAEFRRDSNWLGFYSLRAMTQELVRRRPELQLDEGDPWQVSLRVSSSPVNGEASRDDKEQTVPANRPTAEIDDLRTRILTQVQAVVRQSQDPVLMAQVAHHIVSQLGAAVIESQWAGAGTFKALLEAADGLGLLMAPTPPPGYLYDPELHDPPSAHSPTLHSPLWSPELDAFSNRVARVTGTPRLTPEEYGVLFDCIATALSQRRYNLTATSKAVRDLCIERGHSISRSNVSFVLRGITYTGYRFNKDGVSDTPTVVAKAFLDDVRSLCNDAQLDLTEGEREHLQHWILGGLTQESPG